MSTTIALAGKGGVGKTTIAAMVIKYLSQSQDGAILAIDADPSSNLNMVLVMCPSVRCPRRKSPTASPS